MKKAAVAVALVLTPGPAFAQFDQLGKIAKRAQQVREDINISDQDERAIGEQVSKMLVDRFGVYQDPGVTKYVALVGTVLAQASSRPALDWKFIVLDTDGVNAYAAPGGIVHITRGALGLIKSEAELAGVLGHEITHITAKHSVRAIQKSKAVQIGADKVGASGGLVGTVVGEIANRSYDMVFNNKFGRDDENQSDKVGITLGNSAGYAPSGLSEFLTHLSERNKGKQQPNGLFASHPQLKERLERLAKTIGDDKLTSTATVQARYARHITFDAKPAVDIAPVVDGAAGAVGGSSSASKEEPRKEEEKKPEPKKKRGFGLGKLAGSLTSGRQAESTQASASAGGRMAQPDTDAPGGSNRNVVRVAISAAELEAFKKGIA